MKFVEERQSLPRWTQSSGEELANSISHGIGFVGAIIGTPILLLEALHHGDIPFLIGTIVFSTAMLVVYLASTLYHSWPPGHMKSLLQLLDHSAIFMLIAGTYTPFALGPLRDGGGLPMLWIVWALALFGVVIKATRGVLRHRRLAMTLYLGTGWLGLTFIRPLAMAIPFSALVCLIAGGMLTRQELYFLRMNGNVMPISCGICSYSAAPAVTMRPSLFARPEKSGRAKLDNFARAAD
jgi:hemolysin III